MTTSKFQHEPEDLHQVQFQNLKTWMEVRIGKTYCWATRQEMDSQTGPENDLWHCKRLLRLVPVPHHHQPTLSILKPFQDTLGSPVSLFHAWLSFQLENFSKSWSYSSLVITQACHYLSYVLQTSKTVHSFPSCYDPSTIYFFPIFFSQHHPLPGKKNADRTGDFSCIFTAKIC